MSDYQKNQVTEFPDLKIGSECFNEKALFTILSIIRNEDVKRTVETCLQKMSYIFHLTLFF